MGEGGRKEPPGIMDFNSRRSPVMGTRGMVSSSQPLASEARIGWHCMHGKFCMQHVPARWAPRDRFVLMNMQAGMRILQQGGNAAGDDMSFSPCTVLGQEAHIVMVLTCTHLWQTHAWQWRPPSTSQSPAPQASYFMHTQPIQCL